MASRRVGDGVWFIACVMEWRSSGLGRQRVCGRGVLVAGGSPSQGYYTCYMIDVVRDKFKSTGVDMELASFVQGPVSPSRGLPAPETLLMLLARRRARKEYCRGKARLMPSARRRLRAQSCRRLRHHFGSHE